MHCKQIAKQTNGKIKEIELDSMVCSQAENCRRKGICVLSPYSLPEVIVQDNKQRSGSPATEDENYPVYYDILIFKQSLGYQWSRARDFEEAVRATERRPADQDHPKLIRRVEFFKLPDQEQKP